MPRLYIMTRWYRAAYRAAAVTRGRPATSAVSNHRQLSDDGSPYGRAFLSRFRKLGFWAQMPNWYESRLLRERILARCWPAGWSESGWNPASGYPDSPPR